MIDVSSPRCAADDLLGILNFLRQRMLERPEFIQFAASEFWRFPELKDELGATPRAVASISLIGVLFISVVWQSRGWLDHSEAEWQAAVTQAVECLLRQD